MDTLFIYINIYNARLFNILTVIALSEFSIAYQQTIIIATTSSTIDKISLT